MARSEQAEVVTAFNPASALRVTKITESPKTVHRLTSEWITRWEETKQITAQIICSACLLRNEPLPDSHNDKDLLRLHCFITLYVIIFENHVETKKKTRNLGGIVPEFRCWRHYVRITPLRCECCAKILYVSNLKFETQARCFKLQLDRSYQLKSWRCVRKCGT